MYCRGVLPASEAGPAHIAAREDCGPGGGESTGEQVPRGASPGQTSRQSVRLRGSRDRQDGRSVGDHQGVHGN